MSNSSWSDRYSSSFLPVFNYLHIFFYILILDLKNEFKKILSTFASQKEIVVSQINKLGGEVDESLGIGQEIGSLFSKLKDALITDDEEVLENAVKAMDMGVKQGDKVIGKIEASDANRDIIETLNHMVNEYREISVFLMKIHKGNW